jgi:Phage virion morphogenesis family.
MTVKLTGNDLPALRKLLKSPEKLKVRLLSVASGQALALVQMGFRNQKDPDGVPWVPLADKRGNHSILTKTGLMKRRFDSHPTETGFEVGSNDEKVVFHQEGTKGLHKDYSRKQAYASSGMFVRKSGKARTTVQLDAEHVRTVTRANGTVMSITTKKVLTQYAVAGHKTLNFKTGNGKIPIRRMVPADGKLTTLWLEAIGKQCDATVARLCKEAGAKK